MIYSLWTMSMTLGGKWQFANFCEDVNQKQRRVAETAGWSMLKRKQWKQHERHVCVRTCVCASMCASTARGNKTWIICRIPRAVGYFFTLSFRVLHLGPTPVGHVASLDTKCLMIQKHRFFAKFRQNISSSLGLGALFCLNYLSINEWKSRQCPMINIKRSPESLKNYCSRQLLNLWKVSQWKNMSTCPWCFCNSNSEILGNRNGIQ